MMTPKPCFDKGQKWRGDCNHPLHHCCWGFSWKRSLFTGWNHRESIATLFIFRSTPGALCHFLGNRYFLSNLLLRAEGIFKFWNGDEEEEKTSGWTPQRESQNGSGGLVCSRISLEPINFKRMEVMFNSAFIERQNISRNRYWYVL